MRTCDIEGCGKPYRARGLCSTHYNRTHLAPGLRHPKATIPCAHCGEPTTKDTSSAGKWQSNYCSYYCRSLAGLTQDHTPVPATSAAHQRWSTALPVLHTPPEPKARTPRVFACGTCRICGKTFIAEDYTNTALYCSRPCTKRAMRDTRRARLRAAYVSPVSPHQVYERDGWRCQLCNRTVKRDAAVPHPLAPTVDHIIPLAQGGTHEPRNVQCAHYRCNSKKKASLKYSQQMTLF